MANVNGERNNSERKRPEIDYDRDTVYVTGNDASAPVGNVRNMDGSQYYAPQYFTQSQLNNNMSGTDANAIYQATHDPNYAAQYNQPYMQRYLADLAAMNLTPYRGQYDENNNPGTYVTGAAGFMVPNPYRSDAPESFEQVLPNNHGSIAGMGGLGIPNTNAPAEEGLSQYYANVLNQILQDNATTGRNAQRIQNAANEARFW